LAEVLKQVDTGAHESGVPVPPPHKPETATPIQTTTPQKSEPEKTPVANREEIERLAAEAEAAFSALETTTAPEARNDTADDPLAAKKIEKLFKSSGGERSPFAS
jgi:hypothetical protein